MTVSQILTKVFSSPVLLTKSKWGISGDVLDSGVGVGPGTPKSHPLVCELLKWTHIFEPSTTGGSRSNSPSNFTSPKTSPVQTDQA